MADETLRDQLLAMLELDRELDDWIIPQPERWRTPADHRMPREDHSSLNTTTIHRGVS